MNVPLRILSINYARGFFGAYKKEHWGKHKTFHGLCKWAVENGKGMTGDKILDAYRALPDTPMTID